MRILFAGGGTGGHFYPIVAVYRKLIQIFENEHIVDAKLYYIGPNEFGREILLRDGIQVIEIVSGKWRRYAAFQNIIDIFKVVFGSIRALFVLFPIMPDVIFSKGGYGSIPAVIAAIVYRIPLIIHDSDSKIGLSNRFASRFAKRIALSFASAGVFFPKDAPIAITGNPIRDIVLSGSKEAAREEFSIFSQRPVVLVMGGSQGAEPINHALLGVLKELTQEFEVLHQTGKENFTDVKGEASVVLSKEALQFYHPIGFFDERVLRSAYTVSDIIVSRAGAGSIFEIAAVGKASILIPLKNSAQEHQKQNAYEYAEHGAAVIIQEGNLTPSVLFNEIKKLIENKELQQAMAERAKQFAKPDAAEVIAREILKLGSHR